MQVSQAIDKHRPCVIFSHWDVLWGFILAYNTHVTLVGLDILSIQVQVGMLQFYTEFEFHILQLIT